MIKAHQVLIPFAFWCQHREQWHSCLAFFWVQMNVIEVPPAAFFFMLWTLGVMYCRNGRGGGIPQGDQGNAFKCRLSSCLLQIFHKDSDVNQRVTFTLCLPPISNYTPLIKNGRVHLSKTEDTSVTSIGLCAHWPWAIANGKALNYVPITCTVITTEVWFLLIY